MYRLLIADDEYLERKAFIKTLEKHIGENYIIFEASNGREALEKAIKEDIQIALLDIEMPGINGLEVARRLRLTNKDICIIFLTAFDDFKYAKEAIKVRALEYLLKPWTINEILSVLELAEQNINYKKKNKNNRYINEDIDFVQEEDADRINTITEKMLEYINMNYTKDISMHEAAEYMSYSDAYFCRLFKQIFSKNFTAFLTEFRIERAKQILSDKNMNVKEVGEAVGYFDANYFAKVFKRYTGYTPSEYRQYAGC